MMHFARLFAFFALAFSVIPVLRAEVPSEAVLLDVVGHHQLSRSDILKGFPAEIHTSSAAPYFLPDGDAANLDAWCEQLPSRESIADATCDTFVFASGNPVYVIAIVENGRENFAKAPPAPTLKESTASLDPSLADLHGKYRDESRSRLDAGIRVWSKVENGIRLSDDDELRTLEVGLHEALAGRSEHLLAVIESNTDTLERGTAASLLNWVGEPQSWISHAIPFVNDEEPLVRNNVTRALSMQAGGGNLLPHQIDVLLEKVEPLLHSPYIIDLNKGITLVAMIARSKDYDPKRLPDSIREQIDYLARTSISQNIGGTARMLKERVLWE
jgi:hypothetical protein